MGAALVLNGINFYLNQYYRPIVTQVSYGGLDASSSSESISSGVVSADDLREEGEAHNEVQRRKEEQHAVYEHCALGLVCNAAISVWQHLSRKPGNKGNMHTPALGS
eukprot:scaffold238795_cov20-Tisochrysis_lutea.AAC.1